MFSGTFGSWRRDDSLANPAARTPQVSLNGLTRRQFLIAPPVVGLTGMAAPLLAATQRGSTLSLQIGEITWVLNAEAFGLTTLPPPTYDRTVDPQYIRLAIDKVFWPGTSIVFDLLVELDGRSGPWTIALRSTTLDVATTVPFASFWSSGLLLKRLDPASATAVAKSLGWARTRAGPAALRFFHDLSWRIDSASPFAIADPQARARSLMIRAHGRRAGPLGGMIDTPRASTSATAIEPQLTERSRLVCGGTILGRNVELRPRHYSEVIVQSWNGDRITGINGTWRLDLRSQRLRRGGFDTVNGLVLVGLRDGHRSIRADLPLSEDVHTVSVTGAGAQLMGAAEDHRAILAGVDYRLDRCEVRGLLVRLSLPLPGADYCQLELTDEDVLFVLDGGADPDFGGFFSGDRWRLSLEKSRLRVARADDLLNLAFSFQGMDLVRRGGEWLIEAKTAEANPLMRVDFGPQHILEQAFFRQIDNQGMSAKVDVDEDKLYGRDGNKITAEAAKTAEKAKRDTDLVTPFYKEPGRLVEARLSGSSRIVFKVPPRYDRRNRRLPSIMPFDLDSLTRWDDLELAVARPARRTMQVQTPPLPGEPRKPPVPSNDPTAILLDHCIAEKQRNYNARLKQVVAQVASRPDAFATAIELPARLVLSPDQNARFIASPPPQAGKPASLWTARLKIDNPHPIGGSTGAAVRAIWSPDFSGKAFTDGIEVPHSHVPPWKEAGATATRELRLPMDSADRHELVALTSLYGLPTLPRLPAARDPNSDDPNGLPANLPPPANFLLDGLEEQGVYLPPAMPVRELALSALGANFDVAARFEPPAAPYPEGLKGNSIFPALNIESWDHEATLGRDMAVQIVYKGFLFPLGHRASLVKLTERRFFRGPGRDKPVAYLIQRYFIRIPEPTRSYPRVGHPFDARDFPSPVTRILTVRTPDILDPDSGPQASVDGTTGDNGQVKLNGNGRVFWPRIRTGEGNEVHFAIETVGEAGILTMPLIFLDNTAVHDSKTVKAVVAYYQGLEPDRGLTTASLGGAIRRYAPETKPGSASFPTARWILGARGRGDRPGAPYRMDAVMEGADQPPFYPFMREGHVAIRSIQQFASRSADNAVISFDDSFVRSGFAEGANPSRIFINVHGYLPTQPKQWYADTALEPVRLEMGPNGDRSGGVARPNVQAVALSVDRGPVGGQIVLPRAWAAPAVFALSKGASGDSARQGMFIGLDSFLPDAKLLGLLMLRDLIKTALAAKAPKLIEQAEIAADTAARELEKLWATLEPLGREGARLIFGAVDLLKQGMARPIGPTALDARLLYPGLEAAIGALGKSAETLQTALSGGGLLPRIRALITNAEAVNRCATELLGEIDRIAHHPMPAVIDQFIKDMANAVTDLRKAVTHSLPALFKAQAGNLLKPLKNGACETLIALALGPDAYGKLATIDPAKDIDAIIAEIAQTAAEGLCYERIGRPALQAIDAVSSMASQVQDATHANLEVLAAKTLDITAKIFDSAQNVLQNALLAAQAQCKAVVLSIKPLVDSGNDAAAAGIEDLQALLNTADATLAKLAPTEAAARKLVENARDELARSAPDVRDVWAQAFSQATALLDGIARLRIAAAGRIDRGRETLTSGEAERDRLLTQLGSGLCTSSPQGSIDVPQVRVALGMVTRWTTLRLRAIDEFTALFGELSTALDAILPKSTTALRLVKAERIVQGTVTVANEAIAYTGNILGSIGEAVSKLTTVRATAGNALKRMADQLKADLLAAADTAGAARLQADIDQLVARTADLSVRFDQQLKIVQAATPAVMADALRSFSATVREIGVFGREQERALIGAALAPISMIEKDAREAATKLAVDSLKLAIMPLFQLHEAVHTGWTTVRDAVPIKGALRDTLGFVLRPDVIGPLLDINHPFATAFEIDRAAIAKLKNDLETAAPDLAALLAVIDGWRKRIAMVGQPGPNPNAPAIYLVAQLFGGTLDALVQGRLQDLIDLPGIRRQIETAFFDLPLPKLNLSYSLGAGINDIPPFFKMERDNSLDLGGTRGAEDLSLRFDMTVDLKTGGKPEISSTGILQPFSIYIFEVATLYFQQATFATRNGEKPKVDIKVAKVVLGSAVQFIQALQSYLSPGGAGGFFIDLRLAPPGVEAGFMIDLGTISIGTVSFINVSLGASVELPFDDRPALFRFYLGRRDAPFMISAAPFGGGGFVSLISDAKSIVGFEASFEYGGVAAFGIAGVSGQAQITTGLYVARSGSSAAISGFVRAAGSAHIACFGVSACLLVSVSQRDGGAMMGNATYTFTFSVGITDISYKISVDRKISSGWGSGGGKSARNLEPVAVTRSTLDVLTKTNLARAELAALPGGRQPSRKRATIRTNAAAMHEDWTLYSSYFDGDL